MIGRKFWGIIRNCKSMKNTKVIVPYTSTVLIDFFISRFSEFRFNFLTLDINSYPELEGKVFKQWFEFSLS